MSKAALRSAAVLAVALVALLSFSWVSSAQSSVESLAVQQLSQKTGIDPDLLASIFVTDGKDQYILAFVYINQDVMNSNLKPDLKSAISPYVGQRAVLALVVPTQQSSFSPSDITFSQNGTVYLIDSSQIHAISSDFTAGTLPAQEVSAGVIVLPDQIDINSAFQIVFRGSFSTTLSITGSPPPSGMQPVGPAQPASGILLFLVQFLMLFFLLPFLV